jgi:phage terminase large subunit-like protein
MGVEFVIDPIRYPNCYRGHQYALRVISGKEIVCKYVIGACQRYLDDIERFHNKKYKYWLNLDQAEKYLRLVQKFEHAEGHWDTKTIVYLDWQCFMWINIQGWYSFETGFRRFRTVHSEIPRGQGKAHPLNQLVPTPQGLKLWEEIDVGTKLYSRDGTICEVVGKTPITLQKTFKVIFSDGSEVLTSGEHEWVTCSKKERVRENHHKSNPPKRRDKFGNLINNTSYESVVSTLDIKNTLKSGKETNHLIHNTKPTIGNDSVELDIDAYFLGYWLGNGTSASSSLTCHEEDYEELLSLLNERGVVTRVSTRDNRGSRARTLLTDQHIKLKKLDLLHNKHIKQEWVNLPLSLRLELCRGLLDSDGTIGKDGVVEFYSSIYNIAYLSKVLFCSLGFKVVMSENKVSPDNNFKTNKIHYRIAFSARGDIKLFNLRRKSDRQISALGKHNYATKRYIVDVVELDQDLPMFCVEVNSKDNTYLIGDSFIPTHNSAMASQAALFELSLNNPVGNQIVTAASKMEQARIVLDAARIMASKNEEFLKVTGTQVLAHKLIHKKSFSEMKAISSDAKSGDGQKTVLTIMDELHAVNRAFFEVIDSGMSKRRDSMLLCITTAGTNVESVGFSQSNYAKRVALQEIVDETFFALIYTIDKGDDYFSEISWKKANPNWGVSVDPINFAAKAAKAKENPSDLPNFRVKHLNEWISEANAYFNLSKWDLCKDETLKIEDFRGMKVKVGLDLASKIDLACAAYVFRQNGMYYIFADSYLPSERVAEVKSDLYDRAIESGELKVTPGNAIDYETMEKDIIARSKELKIDECLFDPWNAVQMGQNLTKKKINMVEFKMSLGNLSEATKMLDALIRDGKVRHNGGELMRWCLGNVVVREDANSNIFPRKSHEKLKIDIIIAAIMAIASWIQEEEITKGKAYEGRGIRFIEY